MGCGASSSKNSSSVEQTPGSKSTRNQKRSTRKRRTDGGFSALGEDEETPQHQPQQQQPPSGNPLKNDTKRGMSTAGVAVKKGGLGGAGGAEGEGEERKGSQWAPNTYNHILKETPFVAPSQPVVQSVGNEAAKKRPFRQVVKEALQLAKDQRAKYGKFRKDEKHTVMELYDLVGLEEDTFLGPPNELQERLAKFTYPPPNMHMLRDHEMDDDVVDFMLGAEEAKKRKAGGLEVAPAKEVAHTKDGAKRRQGVSSEATSTLSRMKIFKELPKTNQQTETLKHAMERSVLFKGLDSRDFEILFKAFEHEHFMANSVVFEKGDEGDKFYLIETGRCQIIVPELEGTNHGSIFVGDGDTFGELGVMYGTPRAATIVTTVDCNFWWIDRDTYRGTLMNQMQRKRDRYMEFLENVDILETLEPYEKARIADVLEVEEVRQHEVVVTEGEQGDKFFIVEEGEMTIEKGGKHVGRLKNGNIFGEMALLFGRPRAATVTVSSPTARLVSLSRANFVNYLGPLEEKLRRNTDRYKQFLGKNNKGKDTV